MGYTNLIHGSRCYRCNEPTPGPGAFVNAVQIVRYGYSGAPIDLCTKCFREFKSWLDVNRKETSYGTCSTDSV